MIFPLAVNIRLGQIHVKRLGSKWILRTSNIRRFQFLKDNRRENIISWSVDGTDFNYPPAPGPSYLKQTYEDSLWTVQEDLQWLSVERHPNTYGPMARVSITFAVIAHKKGT